MSKLQVRLGFLMAVLAVTLAIPLLTKPAQAQTKMVFAHYMVVNNDYQDDSDPTGQTQIQSYQREMLQAQAAGFDGFALNCGGWYSQTWYIRYSTQIFEAAAELNNGFKLVFSADFCCGNGVNDAEEMMRRFCNDPIYSKVYFKYNGKFVLTTFSGDNQIGAAGFQQIRSDLTTGANPLPAPDGYSACSNSAFPIFIVPAFFWGGETPAQSDLQQPFNDWKNIVDGNLYWGIAGVPGSGGNLDQVTSSEAYAATDHAGSRLYMAPVCLQFWGANADRYYEYSGYAGLRKMWMDAINVSHPEWVEDITWNDFVEGTYVSPIDDPANYGNANVQEIYAANYNHTHAGATALTSYFIQWYKTGVQPVIKHDSLYWAYRTQPMDFDAGYPSVANKYGPVADDIYITCNLIAPATLKVTSGSTTSTVGLVPGSNDVTVPFTPGFTPHFELDRGGNPIATGDGIDPIDTAPQYNNYYYSTGTVDALPPPPAPTGLSARAAVG